MEKGKLKVIVIVGPTASGKSDLGIQLARKLNGEIISADSRQVYRGMDIGTGKVTKREQRLVRHWLLDVASPRRQYSVAQWKIAAQQAIRDIVHRGKVPIICGGTGFWIDALVSGMTLPDVKPNAKLRADLAKLSVAQMYATLTKLDPVRAAAIDRHNPRRLQRALEIVMTTGKAVPQAGNGSRYEPLFLAVSFPKEKLAARIAKRLDARLKGGMITEVKRLHTHGVSWQRLEDFGLEYRWLARYLKSKSKSYKLQAISYRTMREALLRDIVRYAKRQMTWFKRNPDIHWVRTPRQALALAKPFLS